MYSGKLDSERVEYVVCGTTHKRCNVSNPAWTLQHSAFIKKPFGRKPVCRFCNDCGGIILADQTNAQHDYPNAERCLYCEQKL